MAMVLPITKAAAFLQDLKAGQVKWNGVLDLSVEAKLKGITDKAAQGRWAEAMALADKELKISFDPQLVMAAAMMHFCAGDEQGAKGLFGQSLSMDAENDLARLMLFIIDWLAGRSSMNPYRQELLALDWRSPAEFLGYLVRVLEGLVNEESALKGAKADAWEFFLARAKLDQVQKRRLDSFQGQARYAEYQAEMDQVEKEGRRAKLAVFTDRFEEDSATPRDKREILEKILEIAPSNPDLLVGLAFYSAMEEAWEKALEYARTYLKREGRENAGRLRVGLLEGGILHHMGRQKQARAALEAYGRRTKDPWYRFLSECLLGEKTVDSLKKEAGESPEKLITAHTALGFWAEGSGEKERAIEHYKVALESFMDTWLEFDFARERIKSLRRPPA
jgi:tetratricopeptide (TPR) repeat protein